MAKKRKKAKRKSSTVPSPVASFDDRKFKIEQAARTLIEADEIRANKSFMIGVNAELARKEKAIKKARTRR